MFGKRGGQGGGAGNDSGLSKPLAMPLEAGQVPAQAATPTPAPVAPAAPAAIPPTQNQAEAQPGQAPSNVARSSSIVTSPPAPASAVDAGSGELQASNLPSVTAPVLSKKVKSKAPPLENEAQTTTSDPGVAPEIRIKSEEYYDVKTQVFSALIDTIDLSQLSKLDNDGAREEIRDIVNDIVAIKSIVMSISEQEELLADICNDILGYGPLEPLLERDDIADIMVNGAKSTFIEVDGKVEKTNVRFRDNDQLMNICQRIVSQVGRRVDESSPICDARLADGSRVNVIAPPLSLDGPTLTIRKFKKDKLTLDQLVSFGAISPEGAEILQIIGRVRCNIVISGGTGSGKTTLLNCMTNYIDEDERIITCEDSAELQLQQPHVVRLETRPPNLEGEGTITMTDLVKNCLRMRPERIIVGEVRGPEVFDLLQAMNTGHDGSMGTIHANSPRECLSRMESMIAMGGFSLPAKTVREIIVGSVDIVIQAKRLRDGSRRITHITEVIGLEGDVIITQDIFLYDILGEDANGNILGKHRSTGIGNPKMAERARYFNEGDRLAEALDASEDREIGGF